MKKHAALSPGLVAVKGSAAPVADMPTRSPDSGLQPLNFRVSAEFRREFKTYAAAHDLQAKRIAQASLRKLPQGSWLSVKCCPGGTGPNSCSLAQTAHDRPT